MYWHLAHAEQHAKQKETRNNTYEPKSQKKTEDIRKWLIEGISQSQCVRYVEISFQIHTYKIHLMQNLSK